MDVALDGTAVVITGAGRGIGAACALLAAERGAAVVVNDIDADGARRTAAAIADAGGTAVAHPADVADPDAARALVARCTDEFGHLDGLVNNAALMHLGRLADHDPAQLRRLLDVNVAGGFHCAAAAVGPMTAAGAGSIVNVTSGAHLGLADMSAYAATKGAVASMTYAWAADLAGTGVRVNAISPLAAGAMVAQSQAWFRAHGAPDTVLAAPDPATVAPAVCFLLSAAAAGVTGQVVRVDGPLLSLLAHPAIGAPVLHRKPWTVEAVARAFADVLAERSSPTGAAALAGPEPIGFA